MKISLAFCLLYLSTFLSGGGRDYTLEKVDASADLSHSAVLSIYQDRQGTIWFGTYDGLNSYDGKNIKTFRSDYPAASGLTNNVILTVCQADNNCIWCATEHVLNKFSLETYSSEVYDFGEPYTIHSNDSGDTFLIKRDSLYYYNTSVKDFLPIGAGFVSEGGTAMYRKTYVSVSGEFWYFDQKSGLVRTCSVSSFSKPPQEVSVTESLYSFHTKGIRDVFWQKGIMAFVDVDKDLFLYDTDNKSKVFIKNIADLIERYGKIKGISPFYEDVYIGFAVNGLVRLSMEDEYRAQEVDRNIRIYGMYLDSVQGILWIATDGQGAICYKRKNSIAGSLMLNQLSPELSRQVRSIMTDRNGDLWFGTKGDGLVRLPSYRSDDAYRRAEVILPGERCKIRDYRRKSKEFQVYLLKESDRNDGFWVGTGSDGLCFYSYERNSLQKIECADGESLPEIHSVVEADDSVLYVATNKDGLHRLKFDGLNVVSSEKIRLCNNGHEVELFYPMVSQGDTLLWLGSRTDGLIRFDCLTDDYSVISLSSLIGRSVDDVLSLCLSSAGVLHVGTTSGLISLKSTDGQYSASHIGREEGLLNDMIHGILEDEKGVLWLSTNKGLAKYNPVCGMIHNYYYTSGVEIGEFSDDAYYRNAADGEMFFGGVDGLLVLRENALSHGELQRDLVLREMTVDAREVKLADYYSKDSRGDRIIRIKGPEVSLSFFYSVPDFISGRDIEYSYILEGFNDSWSVFCGSNEATFNSVPSGKYVLKVRYKKDVFDADYRTFAMPVHVVAPWYRSSVAIAVYVCLCIFVMLLVFRYMRRIYVRRKVISRKVGRISATGQEILDRISVIYHCCEQLKSADSEGISKVADTIRDSLSGILQGGGSFDDFGGILPARYVVSNTERLADVSKEVLDIAGKEGYDVSLIDVAVMPAMSYPVYSNAFRRILYTIYCGLASGKERCRVVLEKDERHWLRIVVKGGWSGLWVLYDKLNSSFSMFSQQTGMTMTCVDKGQNSALTISFPPAINENSSLDDTRKNIVLLAEPSDLTWLICDLLSVSYNVIVEESAEKAFEALHNRSAVLFMVDMRLFEGNERIVLDFLNRNHVALSRLSFLPMFTWNTDREVCRELILFSDAYMMLPYDVQMLQNVVHKAIFGKSFISDVQVHELLDNVGSLAGADTEFLRNVLDIVDECLDRGDLGSTLIAEKMCMSSSSFYRKFKRLAKVSPEVLIKNYRLEKAARLLRDTEASISDVVFDVGIASRSYFYKEFSKKYGMTPKEYKEKFCSD